MAPKMNVALRNARLDAISTFAGDSGYLRIYDGTQPATGGTATTLLAELRINATVAPAASGGVLTLNALTADSSANATGTATWARWTKSDGTTHVMDFSVTASGGGGDIILSTVSIVSGVGVSITSAALSEPNA